jgi:hypothetical protein
VPPFYDDSLAKRSLLKLLQPAQALAWKAMESIIVKQFQLKGIIAPTMSLKQDLMYSGSIIDSTWHELVDPKVLESRELPKSKSKSKGLRGGWWARWKARFGGNTSNGSAASGRGKAGSANATTSASGSRRDNRGSGAGTTTEAASSSQSRRASVVTVVSSSNANTNKEEPEEGDEHISPLSSTGSSRQGSFTRQGSISGRTGSQGPSNQGSGTTTPRRRSWRTDLALASAAVNVSHSSKQLERAVEAAIAVSRPRSPARGSSRKQQSSQERADLGRSSLTRTGTRSGGSSASASRRPSASPDLDRRSARSSVTGSERSAGGRRRSSSAPARGSSKRAVSPISPKISEVPLPASWGERRRQALELREKERRDRLARASRISMVDLETCVNIKPMRGEVSHFTQHGVALTNGKTLPVDLVLYCTGAFCWGLLREQAYQPIALPLHRLVWVGWFCTCRCSAHRVACLNRQVPAGPVLHLACKVLLCVCFD